MCIEKRKGWFHIREDNSLADKPQDTSHVSCVRDTSPILKVRLDWAWPSCIFKVIGRPFPRNGFLKHMIQEAERRTGKALWFLLSSRCFRLREKLKLPVSFTKSSHCHLRDTHHKSLLADRICTSPPHAGHDNIHDKLMAQSLLP